MTRIAGYTDGAGPKLIGSMLRAMDVPRAAQTDLGGGMIGCADDPNAWYADDQITVVLDGLIFNPEDLPAPAEAAVGDARRIAESYRRHGIDATLNRVNGDFAIGLHDRASGTLILARDRFGVKPLYYSDRGGVMAFASRPAGLFPLAWVGLEPRPDYVTLFAGGHYRFFDNPPEASPYAAIAQLPAASYLRWRNGQASVHRYYLPADGDAAEDEDVLAEAYRDLFLDAVSRRLARASKPAFTLSGGLDSSSVVCAAAQLKGSAQAAFSTVYGGGNYDESDEIKDVIDHGAAVWNPVPIEATDLLGLIETLTARHDQPVSTVTWLTHYILCNSIREAGHESLFGGLGGDEQHAGEYDYFAYFFADLLAAGEEERYRREVAAWQRHHDHPIWRKNEAVAEERRLTLSDPGTPGLCQIDKALLDRYSEVVEPAHPPPLALAHPYSSYLRSHSFNELYIETMPCCLRASDRNTQAFGLSDFFPFFDHRLVDFMFRVSPLIKTRDGVTKQILRRAMKGLLPEATRNRIGKTGWNAPIDVWFATTLREPLLDLVRSRRFRERGIYRPDAVERIVMEHAAIVRGGTPRENHMMFLWQLISLEGWLDYLDGLSASAAIAEAR